MIKTTAEIILPFNSDTIMLAQTVSSFVLTIVRFSGNIFLNSSNSIAILFAASIALAPSLSITSIATASSPLTLA